MRRKFDTLFGRFIYNKRIAIVEPVFGNLDGSVHAAWQEKSKHAVAIQLGAQHREDYLGWSSVAGYDN